MVVINYLCVCLCIPIGIQLKSIQKIRIQIILILLNATFVVYKSVDDFYFFLTNITFKTISFFRGLYLITSIPYTILITIINFKCPTDFVSLDFDANKNVSAPGHFMTFSTFTISFNGFD